MQAFPKSFQNDLLDLMRWRRDVRRFRTDPVDEALLAILTVTLARHLP